jgi:predicted GNAT family N-acyltransferase
MIIPKYKNKHIGTGIMKNLLNQINEYKKINPNIRAYFSAPKDKESLYKKFGFFSRTNEDLSFGMTLY